MARSLRLAVVQLNPTVGDIEGNAHRLTEEIDAASEAGADLVITPEIGILGYPPLDLLHREGVLAAQQRELEALAELTETGPAVVVGVAAPSPKDAGAPLQNVACVLANGEMRARYAKRLLPTYDVFEEHRYFEPGEKPVAVDIGGTSVGLSVCEDAWHDDEITGQRRHEADPLADLADAGAEMIVTLSASPFSLGKPRSRLERFSRHAERTGVPIVLANQVGANDDLVFDGNSLVVSPDGAVIKSLPAFEEATAVVDPFADDSTVEPAAGEMELNRPGEAREAIRLGIADYFEKTGFSEAVIGLSGGIDSAVTAVLAVDALGPENVRAVSLPSSITSTESIDDARAVAENLDISFEVIPIGETTDSLETAIETETGEQVEGVAAENTQARVRGDVLMTIANSRDALVLTPDNKSEAAVGYCTLYGDTVGALAPLGDCYKSLVYEIATHLNDAPPVGTEPVLPDRVIEKAPTAELSEDQTDADDLPPYDELDPVLEAYIHGQQTGAELREEFPDKVVDETLSRLTRSEFKRRQTPPSIRITDKAFSRGWRYPLAASYENVLEK